MVDSIHNDERENDDTVEKRSPKEEEINQAIINLTKDLLGYLPDDTSYTYTEIPHPEKPNVSIIFYEGKFVGDHSFDMDWVVK